MRAFLEVVDNDGFSAAARKTGRSKALMSKYVRELEDELGILLLNRTTRQFSLTEAGQIYYDNATDIVRRMTDLQESVREAGSGLNGRLRVTAPRSLTDLEHGLPVVEFALAFPQVTLEISVDDRIADLVEEGFDVAIRITRMADSALIVRKLADFKLVMCASPKFLETHGRPNHPTALAGLPAIIDTNWKGRNNWLFREPGGKEFTVSVNGVLAVNSPEVAKRAAMAHLGVTMVPGFSVSAELADGRLESLFDDYMPDGSGIFAVYAHRRHVPAKVRAFVDFLAAWFKQAKQGGTA